MKKKRKKSSGGMKSRGGVEPTKPRIEALLLNQGLLSPYFPSKLVIGLGVSLTICGVILSVFGTVAFLIESSALASLCSGIWVGVVVTASGLIAIISGNKPHSIPRLYLFLFTSMFTVSVTGFLTILTINSVVRDHQLQQAQSTQQAIIDHLIGNGSGPQASASASAPELAGLSLGGLGPSSPGQVRNSPAIMVNTLLLVFASLACVISLINFVIGGREACQCYSAKTILGQHYHPNDPLRNFGSLSMGPDSLWRRDRILQWLLQQQLVMGSSEESSPTPDQDSMGPTSNEAASNASAQGQTSDSPASKRDGATGPIKPKLVLASNGSLATATTAATGAASHGSAASSGSGSNTAINAKSIHHHNVKRNQIHHNVNHISSTNPHRSSSFRRIPSHERVLGHIGLDMESDHDDQHHVTIEDDCSYDGDQGDDQVIKRTVKVITLTSKGQAPPIPCKTTTASKSIATDDFNVNMMSDEATGAGAPPHRSLISNHTFSLAHPHEINNNYSESLFSNQLQSGHHHRLHHGYPAQPPPPLPHSSPPRRIMPTSAVASTQTSAHHTAQSNYSHNFNRTHHHTNQHNNHVHYSDRTP